MKQILLILSVLVFAQCTKTIYVEDLTLRLEPIRQIDVKLGTSTYVHRNDYAYYESYFVHYNKNRVTWYPTRVKKDPISVPINEVYKISYRSRTLGSVSGFVGGYAIGYLLYNAGLLSQKGKPFLSTHNQTVSLATASIFAGAGFSVGIPITYYFKQKKARVRPIKNWELE